MESLDAVRAEYPEATVFASTFDDFLNEIADVASELPEIEGELGDTWINGLQTDPLKTAIFREASRALVSADAAAEQSLLKLAEHTAGTAPIALTWDYNKTSFTAALAAGRRCGSSSAGSQHTAPLRGRAGLQGCRWSTSSRS